VKGCRQVKDRKRDRTPGRVKKPLHRAVFRNVSAGLTRVAPMPELARHGGFASFWGPQALARRDIAVSQGCAMQQIIYSSAAVKDLNEVELSRILLSSRKNNRALGVTGILLYHEGSFLQVLEGEEKKVKSLYDRIHKDPRHRRILILLQRSIDVPQFEDWSMGFVDMKGVADGLPGYSDFLQQRNDPARAGSLAANVLTQFCEGKFRNLVSSR
jgi:Sensors of blue-light using FAD